MQLRLDRRPFLCRLGSTCLGEDGWVLDLELVDDIVSRMAAQARIRGRVTPDMITGSPVWYDLQRPRKPLPFA
jgi:hypothetical protein